MEILYFVIPLLIRKSGYTCSLALFSQKSSSSHDLAFLRKGIETDISDQNFETDEIYLLSQNS